MKYDVSIIGLGYVGLPLGLQFAKSGCRVMGLDIDPAKGLARAKSRQDTENRFEEMELGFHQRIREGFLAIAAAEPKRCHVLDATQDKEALHQQILAILQQKTAISL